MLQKTVDPTKRNEVTTFEAPGGIIDGVTSLTLTFEAPGSEWNVKNIQIVVCIKGM